MSTHWRIRRGLAVLTLTVAAVSIAGGPAWAHPGLRPAEITAGEPTELELVTEHDCDPRDGEPAPTTLVAIQVPEELAAAEALPIEGWRTSAETDDDGRTTVIEWAVEEGAQPATPPTLPLRVTADTTTEATELELVVLQECTAGSYLWGGGDEDEPPVRLTVAAGTFAAASPSPAASPATDEPSTVTGPSTAPSVDRPDDPATIEPNETPGQRATVWIVVLAILLAAAVATAVTLRRRRGSRG